MKNKKLWMVMTLALAAVFVFAACSTEAPVATEADTNTEMEAEAETMEEAAPMEDSTTPLTDDEMIALITEKLAGNHPIDRVLDGEKTREEWETTIDRMIGYGAKISEEEKTLIIDWLLNR